MIPRVQLLIRRIQNELKALKVASPLSIGALKFPDEAPNVNATGSVNTASQDYVAARWVATFTRTDGIAITPPVDFAFDYTVSPTYAEYMASLGETITGNDPNAQAEFYIRGYANNTTNNSVEFYIDVLNALAPYAGQSATLALRVQAISTVEGVLTIRRDI